MHWGNVFQTHNTPHFHYLYATLYAQCLRLLFLRYICFDRSSQQTMIQTRKLSPSSTCLSSAATSASILWDGSMTSPCAWRSWAATHSRGSDASDHPTDTMQHIFWLHYSSVLSSHSLLYDLFYSMILLQFYCYCFCFSL